MSTPDEHTAAVIRCQGPCPGCPTSRQVLTRNANSGFYTCTRSGEPTVTHVTADNKEFYVNPGYTCTKQ
ncbi:MAG TPA: hypothetical protein VFS40_00820 [Gemmatimonadales bacterium]|nr:hypothetical protein [Gemmatimonadales bacterium]